MSSFYRFCGRFALAGLCGIAGNARAQSYAEYDVKAAFLFNFAQFVKWPSSSFADSAAPLTIGILGADPFGGVLEKTIGGESIGKRKLVIKRSRRVDELADCQIIFISRSEEAKLGSILGSLRGTSALTVSDIAGFCRQGGIIGFTIRGGKVRFKVEDRTARGANLHIDSRLLNLSDKGED